MSDCKYCDGQCGSVETYAGQVCMPLNGKVTCIDGCIHQIIAALNAGGVCTVACCCGHGQQDGLITLEDGRELIIKKAGTHKSLQDKISQLEQEARDLSIECYREYRKVTKELSELKKSIAQGDIQGE